MKSLNTLQRITNLMRDYYVSHKLEPTQEIFNLWLAGIKGSARTHFEKLGFVKCQEVFSFRRFQLELKDIGLEEHMKASLTAEDYRYYKSINFTEG